MAEVRFRLEKEQDFRASIYKEYRRGANVADGTDTALLVTSVGLAATGVGLLPLIIATPVAIGHWGWNNRVWVAGSRREIGRSEASSKSQKT